METKKGVVEHLFVFFVDFMVLVLQNVMVVWNSFLPLFNSRSRPLEYNIPSLHRAGELHLSHCSISFLLKKCDGRLSH